MAPNKNRASPILSGVEPLLVDDTTIKELSGHGLLPLVIGHWPLDWASDDKDGDDFQH